MKLLAIVAMLAAVPSLPAPATPFCGGFPLSYSTTIAVVTPPGKRAEARSVEAVAAITTYSDLRPLGWIVWDEHATPWLSLKADSPRSLRMLWTLPKSELDFEQRRNEKVRFAPLTKHLPADFRITACNAVTE